MKNESDDQELLRRYAETGDEEAFGELVRRHVNLVYGCARRRVGGDAHLAEDVTQRVFCDVARQARVLSRHAVLAGWLHTSTRYAAAHVVRAEQRRREREQAVFTMNAANDEAATVEWERLRPVLDETIDALEARDREAVVLRYFEGRSFGEIGARLRLTENAARMRVERALEKLHALLQRRGIGSTAAALGAALVSHAAVVAPAGLAGAVTTTALATGAAAAAGVGGFMSWITWQTGVAGALAAVAVAGLAVETAEVSTLRSEVAVLRERGTSIAALERENLRLGRLAAEVSELRHDDTELARLGNEAGVLRSRLQQVARAEEARAAAARSRELFELHMLDRTPTARFQARPQYPFELRRAGVTGEVVVDFVVNANGDVVEAKALRSTEEGFEAAAVEAVSKWKFAAGQKGGRDVATHMQVPIVFTLANREKAAAEPASSGNSERDSKLREQTAERKAAVERARETQEQRKAERDGGANDLVKLAPFVTQAPQP